MNFPLLGKDGQEISDTWKHGIAKFVVCNALPPAKITVDTGKRNRHDVNVLQQSKVAPVPAIDMCNRLITRVIPKPNPNQGEGQEGGAGGAPVCEA